MISLAPLGLVTTLAAAPQVPTAILRVGDPLPGGSGGEAVRQLFQVETGASGVYSISVATDAASGRLKVWGSTSGGAGTVLREEGTVAGQFLTYSLPRHGLGSTRIVHMPEACAGGVCVPAIWIDDTELFRAGDAAPVPGTEWTGRPDRVGATASDVPYFVWSVAPAAGGPPRRGLFLGAAPQVLVVGGTTPIGLPAPIIGPEVGFTAVSEDGVHFIARVELELFDGSLSYDERRAVVLDGQALTVAGGVLRGGDPVPAAIGGSGEVWSAFYGVDVDSLGRYAVASGTYGSSGYRSNILRDGAFWVRQGDVIDGRRWLDTYGLALDDGGELLHVSTFEEGGSTRTGLFVEDRLLHATGDPIDWDGDGAPDPGWAVAWFPPWSAAFPAAALDGNRTLHFVADVRTPAGDLVRTYLRLPYGVGTNYCDAVANSTGRPAAMRADGSASVAEQSLRLEAYDLPTGSTGIFFVGDATASVLHPGGSAGRLCVGGSIGRFVGAGQVKTAGPAGRIAIDVDLTRLPQPTALVTVLPGDTWHFSAWFRDAIGGVATSNFADGLSIMFE